MPVATENPDSRLSSFLVAGGHLGAQQAADLLADSARTGISLVNRLVAGRLVSQQVLAQAIAAGAGLKYVPPSQLKPAPRALELLTEAQALEVRGLPIASDHAQAVVAFALPPTAQQLGQVRALVHCPVTPVIAEIDALRRAMHLAYHGAGDDEPATDVEIDDARAAGAAPGGAPSHIDELLEQLLEMRGSDLHLTAGAKPSVRVHGVLYAMDRFDRLTPDQIRKLVYDILSEKQINTFEHEMELDAAYSIPSRSRFRMNVFRQRGSVGAVLRVIPYEIPPFDSLALPASIKQLADLPRGLVLVTGPTGSGKSTTLAALLDIINRTKALHIMSCEDPIEFLHTHQRSIVNQREVGQDTTSFASALRRVLREDPDVILVGEMRDLETIHMALTAAETGHLVFGTLHTQSAPQTVDRMIDVFPPEQQGQIRIMLATTLQAVVTQQLVPAADGGGRVAAAEILIATPAVRNLIREGKGHQIGTQMQAGAQHGMVTMDQSLATLVKSGKVALDVALERAANPDVLHDLLGTARSRVGAP
jgi:twitching motility protein PilT